MSNDIDIIIPWVDGSDSEWLAEKNDVLFDGKGDQRANRYRDWDNLKYWFRGVEKFLPWIRKIHFVTWGHLPDWLNTDNPKLHIVKHTDYIPQEYLPVFSSHPIELNFHRIDELSEKFIYSNDDTFFIRPINPDFFFLNDLPVDCAIQNVLQFNRWDGINHIVANNLNCLNDHFNKRKVMFSNITKWFSIKYKMGLFMNFYTLPFSNFTGFVDPHLPNALLKSTYIDVWDKCRDRVEITCKNKVRTNEDINQWLLRYWQFATGKFTPGKLNRGAFFAIGKDDVAIEKAIKSQSFPMVCLSDDDVEVDFETEKAFIIGCLESILPDKCSFEK